MNEGHSGTSDAAAAGMLPLVVWLTCFGVCIPGSPSAAAAQSATGWPPVVTSHVAPTTHVPSRAHLSRAHPSRAHLAPGGHAAADHFDVLWYDLDLDIDRSRAAGQQEILGRVRVQGRALTALDSIRMDLSSHMSVSNVRDVAPGGTSLSFRHEQDILWIRRPTATHETVQLEITWSGTPVPTGFVSWSSGTRFGEPWYWTLSEPYGARSWWPADDHPSDRADSVRVRVRMPTPTRVGSNGLLTAHVDHGDGTATWEWTHRYPIAPYLISIAAGTYDVYEQRYIRPDSLAADLGALSLPIVHYAYAGSDAFDGIDAFSGWKRVLDVFPELEWWYGSYPYPDEKYGHAHVTFGGGMEHQTMSSMGNIGLNLIVHELAHQWFGNARTLGSWRDLWLNEGFATQAEILYLEARQPTFEDEYNFLFPLYRDRALQAEGTLTLQDTLRVDNMFAFPRVYGKGFMVLRMLRTLLGDAAYRRALQTYMAASDRPATPGDLQAALEAESGQDLGPFFDAWVHTGWGHPALEHTWNATPDGTFWEMDLTVRQVQEQDASNIRAFPMPLPVRISLRDASTLQESRRDTLLVLDRQEETFRIRMSQEPVGVSIDPERKSLWVDAAATTSVADVPEASTPVVDIFPNPARQRVSVRIGAPGDVLVVDALGRRISSQYLPAGTHRLDVGHLPAGVYAIRVGSYSRAFMVVR